MVLASKLDEFGKPAWIAATLLGFWLYWPLGLALLVFLASTGRMRAWRTEAPGQWYNAGVGAARRWGCGCGCGKLSSGNAAFDAYRSETLRRLEDEQQEFVAYLERLRRARDKEEFDRFMDERRRAPNMPHEQAPHEPKV